MRADGRKNNQLRPITMKRSYLKYPEGSVLVTLGDTQVICNASVEEKVPPFLKGTGQGWVTAEYAMLPRSTDQRMNRERNSASSRSLEIQRLIGRSLRAVIDLAALGERTIRIDCDVIQADGSTRTASISGAFVALVEALAKIGATVGWSRLPVIDYLSAVSVGIVAGELCLDLPYNEDSAAEVDMNVVMTAAGKLVEIQGSAEKVPFSRDQLNRLLDLAEKGVQAITICQKEALGQVLAEQLTAATNAYRQAEQN